MQISYFPPGDYTAGIVKYKWLCSRCDAQHSEQREFAKGDAIWIPDPLPGGWHKVEGEIFCPAHKVKVTVTDAT